MHTFPIPAFVMVAGLPRLLLLLPALALAAGLSARSLVKADVQLANNAVLAMYQMLLRGVKPKRELYYTDLRLITQEML